MAVIRRNGGKLPNNYLKKLKTVVFGEQKNAMKLTTFKTLLYFFFHILLGENIVGKKWTVCTEKFNRNKS